MIIPSGVKTIVAPYDIAQISNLDELVKEDFLQRAAIYLRTLILQIKKRVLPNKIETKDIIA